MTTDESLDLMIRCLPEIQAIKEDDSVKQQIEDGKKPNFLWLMMGKNRNHTYNFLSMVLGKSVETIKKQPMSDTYADINHVMGGEFFLFFTLLSRMAQTL